MSKKPIKKSDLEKSWLQPRHGRVKQFAPEYHLIISEGTDTEPNYFGEMRDTINKIYRNRIRLEVVGMGDNTISLFNKAKTFVENS